MAMSFLRGILVGSVMGALAVLWMAPRRRAPRKPLIGLARLEKRGMRLARKRVGL